MRTLPHSLICLIHYAELNKAGWWDEAIDRYTLAELWLLKKPAPGQQIRKGILKILLLDIKAQELNKALARLKAKGDIISLGDGRYKLSNETLQRFEACVESAWTLEQTVQEDFCQRVRLACPNLDPIQTWKLLTDQFIVPFVMNEGARTYSYFVTNTKSSPCAHGRAFPTPNHHWPVPLQSCQFPIQRVSPFCSLCSKSYSKSEGVKRCQLGTVYCTPFARQDKMS